jgi:hypothetical protein
VSSGLDNDCLERLCDLAGANEDWLVERVMALADDCGLPEHGGRSPRTLREAVRGLTDAIFQAVYGVSDGYAEGPARHDPVVAYGVIRARTHGPRGVGAGQWLSFLQCYRMAYQDLLLLRGSLEPDCAFVCGRFIDRVFDRFAAGYQEELHAVGHSGQ